MLHLLLEFNLRKDEMKFSGFHLRFPEVELAKWATHYSEEEDEELFKAGRNICEGNYSRDNLEVIVRWKSSRPLPLFHKNNDDEISDALRLAQQATEPRSAFAVLMGLRGVGAPVASTILTAIDPESYTVIDYRALQALGADDANTGLNFYLEHYLPECKRLSSTTKGLTLRNVDRALWTWSKENEKVSKVGCAPLDSSTMR